MSLDTFEQSLLTELRHHVAERSTATRPRRSVARRRTAWIAAPVTAAAAAAVVVGLSLAQSTPAFAVEKASDGDITVTINRYDDAAGLEQALAADGVTAVVDYTPVAQVPSGASLGRSDGSGRSLSSKSGSGTTSDAGTGRCAPAGEATSSAGVRTGDGAFSLTIPASAAYSGAVLHITLGGQPGPGSASSLSIDWTC